MSAEVITATTDRRIERNCFRLDPRGSQSGLTEPNCAIRRVLRGSLIAYAP